MGELSLFERSNMCRRIDCMTLSLCLLVISAVGVHDCALVVLNDEVIHETEQNPMGTWLISMTNGGIWLFVIAKLIGGITVCEVLLTMHRSWPRITLPVATTIASLQLLLLAYLSLF